MKLVTTFALATLTFTANAQSMNMTDAEALDRPVPLVAGLGNTHHVIRTSSAEAQRYFDQGLDYIWAFNHEEARRSFARAAQLDPKAAMPHWGLALAVGPNYNDIDIGHMRAHAAMTELAKARALSANGPATEREYIAALSTRYAHDAKGDPTVEGQKYADAMNALMKHYPHDLDAATLYAESLMDLNPWKLWDANGKPADNTETIVAVLQSVLARDPNHVGANHLLIHAVEASPDPSVALASARRLQSLAPSAGHLVHMPAHIYQRVGDFNDAANSNARAAEVDQAYFKAQHLEHENNMYVSMYYVHNIHFLASSCSMEGNAACTEAASRKLVDRVLPTIEGFPPSEWYTPTLPWMLVRFNAWDKILAQPLPDAKYSILTAMWHYARGCAYTAKHDFARAEAERTLLAEATQTLPGKVAEDFNNPAKSALQLALFALDARLAEAHGHLDAAIAIWEKAVALNDTFLYNEPADWYYPVRESLAGALLRAHRPKEAEAVFRRDLQQNPGNGRSLFGLWQSLSMQHRDAEAAKVQAQFTAAWSHADTKLSIETL